MYKELYFIVPPPPTIPPRFHIHKTYTIIHTHSLPVGCHAIQLIGCTSTTLHAVSEGSTTKVGLAIADKSGLTR